MKKILYVLVVMLCMVACQSAKKPEDMALEFTKLFFVQLAHSHPGPNWEVDEKAVSEALKHFESGNCTKEVYNAVGKSYMNELIPALWVKESAWKSDDYEVIATFNESDHIRYHVAALKFSKQVSGSDHQRVGLVVLVSNSGKTPTISGFEYKWF